MMKMLKNKISNTLFSTLCIILFPIWFIYVKWCWKHHPELFEDFK